jgi:glycosyltransferase involved in cell wall biosynthesis
MKIFQVIQVFSPLYGGGSIEIAYQLSKVLAQRGHTVPIYTADFDPDEEHIDSLEVVKIYPFCCIRLRRLGFGFYFASGMLYELRKQIKSIDIIHVHNYITFQNVAACYYPQQNKIPYFLQAHGGVARKLGRKWINKISDTVFGYRILMGASKLIAVANTEPQEYKEMGTDKNKIVLVPHGLDINSFSNLPPRQKFKKKNDIREKRWVCF